MRREQGIGLDSGVDMPRLGLGVYQSPPGKETQAAVRVALDCGYRHIDTARAYGNEGDVGEAVRNCGIRRSEIFVTTKLRERDYGLASSPRPMYFHTSLLGRLLLDAISS